MKQAAPLLFGILLLACAAGGYYAFAVRGESTPISTVDDIRILGARDRTPPEPPPEFGPALITAWEKPFSAQVGWYGLEETTGCWNFIRPRPGGPEALPAFSLGSISRDQLAWPPAPGVPFALGLRNLPESKSNLNNFSVLKSLRLLDLSETGLGDEALAEMTGLDGLEHLNLAFTAVTDEGLNSLASLKNLQTLILVQTSVTDEGLKILARMKHLRSIDVRATAITDVGLMELAKIDDLEVLILNRTSVTDEGLSELAALPRLRSLHLSGTDVTKTGLRRLSRFKALRSLNLRFTRLSDADLPALITLANVQTLQLKGTALTDEGIAKLTEARPTLKILR